MIHFKRTHSACVLAIVLMTTTAGYAATFHVAQNGSNNNPGSEAEPWRNVAHAVNSMNPGDTTYVHAGTYDEGEIRFRKSGTEAAPIKLLNSPGETPVIRFVDSDAVLQVLIQHAQGHNKPMGWITVQGFKITNGYNGIKMYNGHDITIRGNWIHDNHQQGILGNGTRVVIDRNKVSLNGSFELCETSAGACNQDHGLYFHGSSVTVTNNVFYGNLAYGIQLNGSSTSVYNATKHAGTEFSGAADWLIANNTFAYQANRPGMVVWGSLCNNARIENNIFYENNVKNSAEQGIGFTSTQCTGVKIRNNLFFASGGGGSAALGSGAVEGVHYTQSGNIHLAPAFVNAPANLPDAPDFALTAASPARNSGLAVAGVTTDFMGIPRPQEGEFDIGAFEFSGDVDATPPAAPTGLQVD